MTIETVNNTTQQPPEESIKVPIGKLGHHISVPSLREFFEKKALEEHKNDPHTSPPARGVRILTNNELCDEQSKTQTISLQVINPESPTTPKESPGKVHFGDGSTQTSDEVFKEMLKIDIGTIPTFQDLQHSLTPRGSPSNKTSPPAIKRGKEAQISELLLLKRLSTSQLQRKNPLQSPRRIVVSSSTGSIPVNQRGGGFSPRHRVSHLSPRTASTVPTTLESSVHDKLKNDDWIDSLPDVRKRTRKFNKSAAVKIIAYVEQSKTSTPNIEAIKKDSKEFIRLEFDHILQRDTNEFLQNPLKIDQASSPRSTMYMKYVLEKIQTNGTLLRRILPSILEMKKGLIAYLEKKKRKTEWTMRLANLLSYLQHYSNDLVKFMDEVNKISDKETLALLNHFIDNRLFNFLREFADTSSHLLLRPDLAEIHLDFHDALKIHTHRHFVWEPQDTIIKFSEAKMSLVAKGFTAYDGLRLETFAINKEVVETDNIIGGGVEAAKLFFTDLLQKFYKESKKEITPQQIKEEVESILEFKNPPSKELLSLCIVPWKHFHEAIRLLYPGLQCDMATLPEEGKGKIHIVIDPDGTYRIIRSINYISYQLKRRLHGSSHVPDFKKPIGSIEFVWTVSPCLNEKEVKTWSGCIQIPRAIQVEKNSSYEMKWKMLRSLIDYVEVQDQMTVSGLPIITDESEATGFNQALIEAFDRSEPYVNYVQPSAFMLEFIVKNFCREVLIDRKKSSRGIQQQMISVDELAEGIWEELKINGRVLEPLMTRLSIFDEKLRRYLMIKSKRTSWTDRLLGYLKALLLSTKYAEYGTPVKKDLETFLRIIEKDIKDGHTRQLILNVMCGRWDNFNGRTDNAFQDQHIREIIGTLRYFKDSPRFLKDTLSLMLDEFETISKHSILSKNHIWVEPPAKKSPISNIEISQIVRCFMKYTRPIFDEIIINGAKVNGEGLRGSVVEMQKEYFKRLLKTIYSQYAPRVNEKMIDEQATYMVEYGPTVAEKNIHCLDLLRYCANSCWMVADMFMRYLFPLNNPPIRTSMLQGISLNIEIDKDGKYSVEHRRTYGVYPRDTPDNINSNTVFKDQCLAKIPISWKLEPFTDNKDRKTTMGTLRVMDIIIKSGILPEYEYTIIKALHNYDSDFRKIPNWEDTPKEPKLIMPLASPEGKRLPITSPRYVKRPK